MLAMYFGSRYTCIRFGTTEYRSGGQRPSSLLDKFCNSTRHHFKICVLAHKLAFFFSSASYSIILPANSRLNFFEDKRFPCQIHFVILAVDGFSKTSLLRNISKIDDKIECSSFAIKESMGWSLRNFARQEWKKCFCNCDEKYQCSSDEKLDL